MKYKDFFISTFGIVFQYPEHWKTGREDNNTYLLYNENIGSFRITPLKVGKGDFNLKLFLNSEFADGLQFNPEWLTLGDFTIVYYKKIIKEEEDDILAHYFTTGIDNMVLVISFSYLLSLDNSLEVKSELENVKQVIASIRISLLSLS
jgi:hypothetical protein